MAAGDFTDVVERALYLARRQPDDDHDLARGGELVNEGHMSTCDSGDDWTFLRHEGTVTLTAGTDKYTYASIESALGLAAGSIREILGFVNDSEGRRPLERMDWHDLETLAISSQESDEGRGLPMVYARINDEFRLYPCPDAADTLGVLLRLQPALLSGNDTFLIPGTWAPRLLINYAATRLLWEDGSRDGLSLADRLNDQYERDLKTFRSTWATPEEDVLFRSPGFSIDLDGTGLGDHWSDTE